MAATLTQPVGYVAPKSLQDYNRCCNWLAQKLGDVILDRIPIEELEELNGLALHDAVELVMERLETDNVLSEAAITESGVPPLRVIVKDALERRVLAQMSSTER